MNNAKALQGFLRKKGIEELTEGLKILVKVHPQYPNLYQFKYNQIESPMFSDVVQACRGIILDKNNNWNVVCHTFNKFFNSTEMFADLIDWNSARVFTKEDGSLMQLFYYDNQWHVATSGSPDAGGNVGDFGFIFKDLFWNVWSELKYNLPEDKDLSYAFELCTKYNRIVVNHNKPRIVFLGARNNKYGYELEPNHIALQNGWEVVKQYDLTNLDDVVNSLKDIDPYNQEGYVVCDSNFNRIKVKAPQYVAIHHVIGSMSQRNILEIVRKGETEELIANFPEWQDKFKEIQEKYNNLVLQTQKEYDSIKGIKNQKDFADKAKKVKTSSVLFNLRSGKCFSIKQYLSDMNIKNLEEWLNI